MRFHQRSLWGLFLRACLGLAVLAALPVEAQPGRSGRLEKATLDLAAERATYAPGDTARLTALITVEYI